MRINSKKQWTFSNRTVQGAFNHAHDYDIGEITVDHDNWRDHYVPSRYGELGPGIARAKRQMLTNYAAEFASYSGSPRLIGNNGDYVLEVS